MFSDPVKNIESAGILPGQNIADFGAGSGHYSIAAAKALMATGRVYAIDAQKDLLSKLKNQAAREGLYNLEVIWGNIEKPNGVKLPDYSVDLVLLCNVFFQAENKDDLIKETKRVLRLGGRVLVVDWADSFGNLGPPPEMIIKKDEMAEIFQKAGFHLEKEISAGSHHYGMIYKKL